MKNRKKINPYKKIKILIFALNLAIEDLFYNTKEIYKNPPNLEKYIKDNYNSYLKQAQREFEER